MLSDKDRNTSGGCNSITTILHSSMPCKKLPKEVNQPPITTLLTNCTKESKNDQALFRASANSSNRTGAKVSPGTADSIVEAQAELNNTEFIEVESNKKRKRRNRSSGSPKIIQTKNPQWRIQQK